MPATEEGLKLAHVLLSPLPNQGIEFAIERLRNLPTRRRSWELTCSPVEL